MHELGYLLFTPAHNIALLPDKLNLHLNMNFIPLVVRCPRKYIWIDTKYCDGSVYTNTISVSNVATIRKDYEDRLCNCCVY